MNIVSNILKYFAHFIQISNNGYFVMENSINSNILDKYNKLIGIFNKKNIGPKPISLTKNTIHNMILNKEDMYNIVDFDDTKLYYKITDKADGLRYFMYIDNIGQIYLINDNNNVIQTGVEVSLEFKNSVLDGEYLFYDNIYEYKFFDIYILNSEKVYTKILDDRIDLMNKLDSFINSDKVIKYLNKDLNIKLSKKPYLDLDKFNDILINKEGRNYIIDGIIFMPTMSLNNISNINNNKILKYKPVEYNSIDVLVKNNKLYCGFRLFKSGKYILSELQSFKPYIFNIDKPDFIYNSDLNQ